MFVRDVHVKVYKHSLQCDRCYQHSTQVVVFPFINVMELKKYKGRHALLKNGLNFRVEFWLRNGIYWDLFTRSVHLCFKFIAHYLGNRKTVCS